MTFPRRSAQVAALSLLLTLSAASFPARSAAHRAVYSIAIGNNQPPLTDRSLPVLRYADDDAVRFHELLRRAGTHAALLTVMDAQTERRYPQLVSSARPPTLVELLRTLARFAQEMVSDRARGDDPVLFLTYSGHSANDPALGQFLALLDGGLTRSTLYDRVLTPLADVPTHLIIDACDAAGVIGVRGPFDHERDAPLVTLDAARIDEASDAQTLAHFTNVGALVASAVGQEAHEWSRIEAGVFSHEVVSALVGAADINGDLRIEYSEVQAFAASAVRTVSDPRAVPEVIARAPSADPHAVLIDLVELRDAQFLTGDLGGRITLTLADGRRWLDAHFAEAVRWVVALPAGAGAFVERTDGEAELPAAEVTPLHDLSFQPAHGAARGAIERTLQDELFAAPYTQDYYRGFVDSRGLPSVSWTQPRALPVALPGTIGGAPPGLTAHTAKAATTDHDDAAPHSRLPSLVLAIVSGAALTTAGVTAAVALDAKDDFGETSQMRRASELNTRYATFGTASWIALGAGLASGLAAWALWPSPIAAPTSQRAERSGPPSKPVLETQRR